MSRKRQVDCSFLCPDGVYVDFAVWPRRGQTKETACWEKLRALKKGGVGDCELSRSRYIDGLGRVHDLPLRFSGRKRRVRIVREDT